MKNRPNANDIRVDSADEFLKFIDGSGVIHKILDDTNADAFPAKGGDVIGGSTAVGKTVCSLDSFFSIAGVGNGADATDDVLYSVNLPANGFSGAAGLSGKQRLVITGEGIFAATANAKTLKFKFGALSITLNPTTGSPNNKRFNFYIELVRTGVSTQLAWAEANIVGVSVEQVTQATGAETETAAILISITGASGASAANDILLNSAEVVFIN